MEVDETNQNLKGDLPIAGQGENPQLEPQQDKSQLKKKRKKRKSLISNILIVVGILLIVVPPVLTYMNSRRSNDIIEEFLKQSEGAVSGTDSMIGEDVESFYIPEAMIPVEGNTSDVDFSSGNPLNTGEPTENTAGPTSPPAPTKKPIMSKEEIQKRMTGVLIIKKIDVRMVIMDGVDDETLRVAAGRMPNTGKFDEIGNCVLAGHRSYTLGKYFNRLDELESGDEITIQTATKTLKYIIYKKIIVEPTDFSITNKNGTDKILTLFTCHPVAIASHRLVVHAKQVE